MFNSDLSEHWLYVVIKVHVTTYHHHMNHSTLGYMVNRWEHFTDKCNFVFGKLYHLHGYRNDINMMQSERWYICMQEEASELRLRRLYINFPLCNTTRTSLSMQFSVSWIRIVFPSTFFLHCHQVFSCLPLYLAFVVLFLIVSELR